MHIDTISRQLVCVAIDIALLSVSLLTEGKGSVNTEKLMCFGRCSFQNWIDIRLRRLTSCSLTDKNWTLEYFDAAANGTPNMCAAFFSQCAQ